MFFLEFKPNILNVLYGEKDSGKSTVLDAIALTDTNDHEFHAMLKYSHGEASTKASLDTLVRFNFFTHQHELESFKSRLVFSKNRIRLLEIWKTDHDVCRSAIGNHKFDSPFIFVFDSVDPRRLAPRPSPYKTVNKVFNAFKLTKDNWPLHYLRKDIACSTRLVQKLGLLVRDDPYFQESMRLLSVAFPEFRSIHFLETTFNNGVLVKLKESNEYLTIAECPQYLSRLLKTLIFVHHTPKKYFMIDDIDFGLTKNQMSWLVSRLCKICLNKKMQLFVSTSDSGVLETILGHAKNQHGGTYVLELKTSNNLNIVTQ